MDKISIIPQPIRKKKNSDFATIFIRGYFNRKVVSSKSTGYKIKIENWDIELREVKSDAPNAKLMNSCISSKINSHEAELMKIEITGNKPTKKDVKRIVQGLDGTKDFIAFARERISLDYENPETKITYSKECDKLEKFQKNILFGDIDYDFLSRYKIFLRDQRNNKPNTIWKAFKFMNTMMIRAIDIGGIIEKNPFGAFDRGKYQQPKKTGIELIHCNLLEEFVDDTPQPLILRKVCIYMLLMIYSGMRFNDAMKFDPDKHVKNGRLIMMYGKGKTNVDFKLHKKLAKIVEMVRDNRLVMTNQEFNRYLKVIAAVKEIPINLTTHIGRHTLGTLLAAFNIPKEKARLILGHKSIKSTDVYYHIEKDQIDIEVEKLNAI